MNKKLIFTIIATSMLSACSSDNSSFADHKVNDNSNSGSKPIPETCIENGDYACKSGETEPLYPFQWALNYKDSFFKSFKDIWKADSDTEDYDLRVEELHKQGIKGQGINVLVLDDGLEINHEDLITNINKNMTYNFLNNSNDPTPENITDAHGTNVAGIIAAAQNSKGTMGIAPKVSLGGANYLTSTATNTIIEAYGGAEFSKNADIINASYGTNPTYPESYETNNSFIPLRSLTNLRNQKGILFIKASGNEFNGVEDRLCPPQFTGKLSCENPAHDTDALEPNAIVVAAANTQGRKASYSNAGAINWVTGLGGEDGSGGAFGEGDNTTVLSNNLRENDEDEDEDEDEIIINTKGPSMFSTDLQGCDRGYSKSYVGDDDTNSLFLQGISTFNEFKNNLMCNYSYMNGTSAATPTVTGVIALILQVNPDLTWRDVRDILSKTSRPIDLNYSVRTSGNALIDLTDGTITNEVGNRNDIIDGATEVPLELGWQTNGAGLKYSNWYGFGLIDATAAVKLAKQYKAGTLVATSQIPNFTSAFPDINNLDYEQVTSLGQISINTNQTIDQFQLRVTGPLCIGSVGFFVKSPSGVISPLSTPYNVHYESGISDVDNYGLGSYAFYGEQSTGKWEVLAVSGDKGTCENNITATNPLKIEYRIIPKVYS